jgi:hypothetical protein
MNGNAVPGGSSELADDLSDGHADAGDDGLVDGDADVSMNVEAPTSPPADRIEVAPLNMEEREEVSESTMVNAMLCYHLLETAINITNTFSAALDKNCLGRCRTHPS